MDIDVTRDVLRAGEAAAKTAHPREACGLLLGSLVAGDGGSGDGGGLRRRITVFAPAVNVHPAPETHFEIDPSALIAAHRGERAGGLKLLGYFHSHPTGDPRPSRADRASSAGDGRIWAISGAGKGGDDRTGGIMKFWEDGADGFTALSYSVID